MLSSFVSIEYIYPRDPHYNKYMYVYKMQTL